MLKFIAGLFAICCCAFGSSVSPAKLRVFLLDGDHIQKICETANREAYAPAIAQLRKDADRALKAGPFTVVDQFTPASGDKHDYMSQAPYFWPDPQKPDGLPYIRKDGERNREINKYPDHRSLDQMANAVETLALAWRFTGEEKFAAKARAVLRAWFVDETTRMNPNLEHAQFIPGRNTGRGIGIIESRGLTQVVDAIGLLDGCESWKAEDQKALEQWFTKYLDWMLTSQNGKEEAAAQNNHGTFYDIQVVSFALFVGRNDLAKSVIDAALKKRIAAQIEPDGRQPLELARTKAWSYSVSNLRGLMTLARLGEDVGVDLWHATTSDGRSLQKAIDYLIPYASSDAKWPHQQIGGPFPKDALYPIIRIAAVKYPDARYRELAAKIPEIPTDSRQRLIQRDAK